MTAEICLRKLISCHTTDRLNDTGAGRLLSDDAAAVAGLFSR